MRTSPRPAALAALLLAVSGALALPGCAGPRGQARAPVRTTAPTTSTTVPSSPSTTRTRTPGRTLVVGLGDSVTSGYACRCRTFVALYAERLPAADGGPARSVNLGVAGSTSTDLLHDLVSDDRTRSVVASADIDLITIGANDLTPLLGTWLASDCDHVCYDGAVDQVGRRMSQILAQVRALRAGRPTRVLVTGYWNVFVDGQVGRERHGTAYLAWSDRLTRVLDDAICRSADEADARCVRLYATFKDLDGAADPTTLLAPDGDHPNAAGHRAIAETLLAATPPLTSSSPTAPRAATTGVSRPGASSGS